MSILWVNEYSRKNVKYLGEMGENGGPWAK